ncbi:MAG: hypothetical protein LAKADJCE_01001 [Candidatus Argoarchaeum ethanivorans]|uniref:Uncharacterized protein n=1 Tax=Candidatus Argoarchaeum ethanivorans TaxID=2608793 RepID=A0A811TGA1_9EURY|nr:MAG: hypothetical protein LAKADJCE_01001 [Candidatus Argoarchaeum ethanivorans]
MMFPVITDTSFNVIACSLFEPFPMIVSATAKRSESVTFLPLLAMFLMRKIISFNCSSVGCMPAFFSVWSTACLPACLPSTILRFCPTISGVIMPGSKVSDCISTPWVCMPDSCANAFSPTTGMVIGILTPVKPSTIFEVSNRYSVLMLVLTSYMHWRLITTCDRSALPARSPNPLIVTCTCEAPASHAARLLAAARPKSLWQ